MVTIIEKKYEYYVSLTLGALVLFSVILVLVLKVLNTAVRVLFQISHLP